MRILVVRIYYIDINIFIDIFISFSKFTLAYSIDIFIFVVYIFSINIGQEADIVNFIIILLKRLRIIRTFNISGAGRIKFVFV